MKIFFLIGMFLFCNSHLLCAAAPQMMQQQKQMQEAVIQKAVIEQQIAQQAVMQKAIVEQQIAKQVAQQALQQEIVVNQEIPISATFTMPEQARVEDVQSVVEMSDILRSLETSSQAWPLIISSEPKLFIIMKYIDSFKKRGAMIRKPPEEYLTLLDGIMAENAELIKNPFENVFQFVAILEYDFDTGQNKDQMIIDLIGKDGYKKNKERLGLR